MAPFLAEAGSSVGALGFQATPRLCQKATRSSAPRRRCTARSRAVPSPASSRSSRRSPASTTIVRSPDADRSGHLAGQAPADDVLRRSHSPHAHAHERQLAPLPPGRALAAAGARHADRSRHGRLCRRRLQRAGRRVHDRARSPAPQGARPSSGPTCSTPGSIGRTRYAGCAHTEATIIADVLLNQRVLSGIGNVFKSEICSSPESTRSEWWPISRMRISSGSSTSRGSNSGPTSWIGRRHSAPFPDAARREASIRAPSCGCTDAVGSRAGGAGRRSRRRRQASTPGSHTGAPGVSRDPLR